jgi:hypothetical protein
LVAPEGNFIIGSFLVRLVTFLRHPYPTMCQCPTP